MHTDTQKPNFDYPEDKRFFAYLLGKEAVISDRFDFSEPGEKRAVFNRIRKHIFREMTKEGRTQCELHLVKDCNNENLVIDHIIPLSTNELNKHLRNMAVPVGKKIPSQSFGSNHPSNFLVACEKCNGFKKHRFIRRENEGWVIVNVKSIKNFLRDP